MSELLIIGWSTVEDASGYESSKLLYKNDYKEQVETFSRHSFLMCMVNE